MIGANVLLLPHPLSIAESLTDSMMEQSLTTLILIDNPVL